MRLMWFSSVCVGLLVVVLCAAPSFGGEDSALENAAKVKVLNEVGGDKAVKAAAMKDISDGEGSTAKKLLKMKVADEVIDGAAGD